MVRAVMVLLILLIRLAYANDISRQEQGDDLVFHADNLFLTERVNLQDVPYSTAVDTVQMLFDELGYTSPVLHVPLVRSFLNMENGENVCVLNRIKSPERERSFLYSLPLNFFQTQRFYQIASLPPINEYFLNADGEVQSIHDVLASYPESFIVLPEFYSFGEKVDADIGQVDKNQILRVANDAYYSRFMNMFANGKSDFALLFPATVYRNFGEDMPVAVRSYAIAGNPSVVSGHVICPSTQQGASHIERINSAIKLLYTRPEFIEAHTNYLPAQDIPNLRGAIEIAINDILTSGIN
ncbi:hypothetical protein KUL42_28520 [Alteromonas sp. KUL42]|uniref:hypothetical protein n=1 Tax=Alteromonas sp. KUL42 TaxID=2480797 RepID=UPI0010FFAD49|nr:hypothetical protein [Alteromonas sp. KUL42]GEA08091.1 hypothetical protein KUL42_28520 [Alteromonas sp. KUL42]